MSLFRFQYVEKLVLPVWFCNCPDADGLGVAQHCVAAIVYIARDEWTKEGRASSCVCIHCTYVYFLYRDSRFFLQTALKSPTSTPCDNASNQPTYSVPLTKSTSFRWSTNGCRRGYMDGNGIEIFFV